MYEFDGNIRKQYESLQVPLIFMDVNEGIPQPILATDGFFELHGLTRDKFGDSFGVDHSGFFFEKIHPDETAKLRRITNDFVMKNIPDYDVVFKIRRSDGYHDIHAVGQWQTMPGGEKLAVIYYSDLSRCEDVVKDISDKYSLFQSDDFYTDQLTKLPNINYFHKYGHDKAKELILRNKRPVIMYYDVNSMQSYNNQYSFERGNDLLVLIADILREAFPDGMVIRGADDHFIVLDSMLTEKELGKRIEKVNERIKGEAYGNTTGIQTGICAYERGMSIKEGIDHAKQSIKLLGDNLTNCYRFFESWDMAQYTHERYIVENFQRAKKEGWIRVYYQCFLKLDDNKGTGFEALARWVDPVKGVIAPDDFIPALEKYHLSHELDLYMFEKVCSEIKPRFDNNLPLLPVSVNFSRRDFDYVDVAEELERIIKKYKIERYNIDKSYFVIEITEQDMATGTERFFEQLEKIRKNGYKIWIDDFGSGYSSLNVFSRFDIDLIKFDMELLRNLDVHNSANRIIIKAFIDVAKQLGIHTLCEGMETEEQKSFLLSAGCELAQGYLYHKPEPLDTIFARLGLGIPIPEWADDEDRKEIFGSPNT